MTAIRANIVGPLRDTSNSACIATCQSGKSVSFFGSPLMYSPASISVTINRPSASDYRILELALPTRLSHRMFS